MLVYKTNFKKITITKKNENPTFLAFSCAYALLNCELKNTNNIKAFPTNKRKHINCHNYTSVNWPAFQQVFKLDNWYQEAVNVAYGSELEESWRHQHLECPLGFTLANLVKAMLCANTESVCFPGHAAFIFQVLEKFPLHYTGGTNWPVFAMTKHVAKVVTRHGFSLDFLSDELRGEWTPPFSLAMQDFLSVLVRLKLTNQDNLVVMTMVYGTQFVPYIKRFMQRAHVLGVENLIVFTLDDEAYARCVKAQGLCIRGKPTILHKFTLPLMFLHAHYDVLWIDFDVFLFKNPIPHVLARAHETNSSILTSGAFGADCVNSGIVFFSSTNEVKVWVFHVLHWLYEHPYEHDQKTVSAFLRAGERVAFEEALPVQAPRWDYLDPAVQFVSARHVPVAGWTGDMRDIVIFHFLNGDSDASVGSHQFAQRVGLGDYRMLMDAFYNRTEEDLYSTTKPPWEVAPALRELLMLSWQESRPTDRKRCNSTVPMRY